MNEEICGRKRLTLAKIYIKFMVEVIMGDFLFYRKINKASCYFDLSKIGHIHL